MRRGNFALRLQPSLLEELRKAAELEGVALRGIPFSIAFENFEGYGAIATATPFPKIVPGTQSRNLFRHCHIDELV